jgi:hypothetical protein
MARIRTIKPDFWTDEKLTECSLSARLLFIGLWNFADDNGNLVASAKKIKMQIFPADNIDCQPLLNELIAQGVLIEYSVNCDKYLNIKNFSKHQKINRPSSSSIPQPLLTDGSLNPHGEITDGREGKGKGKEVKNPPNPPAGGESSPDDKPKRERKARVSLKTFVAKCTEAGEKPISEYRPLQEYVEATGLPWEFVQITWDVFKREFLPPGQHAHRLQADWRRHFLNYVEKGYYRLWFAKQGETGPVYELTTQGIQAQASLREAA